MIHWRHCWWPASCVLWFTLRPLRLGSRDREGERRRKALFPFTEILRLFSRSYSLFSSCPIVCYILFSGLVLLCSNIFVLKALRAQSLTLCFPPHPPPFPGLMASGTIFMQMTLKCISPTQNFLLNSRLIYQATSPTSPFGCLVDVLHPWPPPATLPHLQPS